MTPSFRSRNMRSVLALGTAQAIGWIEKAQECDYDLECLENAQDFIETCIQFLRHERTMDREKKIQQCQPPQKIIH